MYIKSALDIGRMVRLARGQKGWSQSDLAEKLGTSQRWVSEIENGKSRAELGRVLKCLRVLEVELEANYQSPKKSKSDDHLDIASFILKNKPQPLGAGARLLLGLDQDTDKSNKS